MQCDSPALKRKKNLLKITVTLHAVFEYQNIFDRLNTNEKIVTLLEKYF